MTSTGDRLEAHGPAVVHYNSLGEVDEVTSCLFPDGARGDILIVSPGNEWIDPIIATGIVVGLRPWSETRAARRGEVRIESDDVRFVDWPDLGEDMLGSPRIRRLACDDRFAELFYCSLCNIEWSRDGLPWMCWWREAGDIIATLRDRGETYLHFYCANYRYQTCRLSTDVAEELSVLGWTPLGSPPRQPLKALNRLRLRLLRRKKPGGR